MANDQQFSSAFIEEYRDLVCHLAQQGDARLRPHVTEVPSGGKAYNFETLGATSATEKTGRRVNTSVAYADDTWARRIAQPRTFFHALTVEHEEKVQAIVNPESAYAMNQAMAMKRQYDELCYEASLGTALDGEGTANILPTDQVVGDGTTPISFDMVTEVQEVFMANEIDATVPKIMVIGPTQVRKLLQLTEQTSGDYVQRAYLQQLNTYGVCAGWMGFDWILYNNCEVPSAGELRCVAFSKQAIGLAVNENMLVRIGENPELAYMIQVFAQFTAGAVRIEDEHVVELHVLNSL